VTECSKGCGGITEVRFTYEGTVLDVVHTLPRSKEGPFIGNREHDDPRSRVMPCLSVFRMLKGEGEACVENLRTLQAG
jgi:hypothetical protein